MQKSCLIICNKIENQNFKQVAPDSLIKNTVFTAIKTIVKKTELIVVISEKFLKSNILLLPTLLRLQNIKKISSIVLVSDSNYYFSQIIVVNINELSTVLKNLNGSSPAPVSDNYTDVFYDFLLLNTLELLNVVFLEDYKMIGRVFNKIAELLEICLMPATAFIGQTTKDATELYISPNSFVDGNTIKEILSEKGLTFTNLKIYEQKKEQQYTKKYLEESKLFFLKNNNFFAGIIFANNQIKDLDRLDTVIDIIFNKIFDIINIKSAVIREHMISVTDYLTGIYNRRFFDEFLKKEIVIMKRKKSVFSLLLFDIDYFKKINDTYGHTAGDQILV
ncbi:MAG: diguanylate cyclase, partial [Deferribacteraceae bacterium]|nr:diguanylate cyclase [Deferribacteraceae bacterium]